MELAAVVAMEGSPAASGVPHPRDRRDCCRLAEVVGPRRAPPSLLVPHSGYGPPLPLHPALLLLHFRFPAVVEGRLSLSTLLIWSTGGEPGCVRRRWHPASAPHKVQKLEKLYVDMALQRELKNEDGSKVEYRVWNPFRSKLAAAVLGGVDNIWIVPGTRVLYIGAAGGLLVIDAARRDPAAAAEERELAAASMTPSREAEGRPGRKRGPGDGHRVMPSSPCPSGWHQQGHMIFSLSQVCFASCSV